MTAIDDMTVVCSSIGIQSKAKRFSALYIGNNFWMSIQLSCVSVEFSPDRRLLEKCTVKGGSGEYV